LIAWSLAAAPDHAGPIRWLGGAVDYPLQQGAAAAIYYGERLYQFPVGVLGIAVATVIFPMLSRHAARNDRRQLGADLTMGLRLVLFVSVPASVGLIILAHPLAKLLFEHGEFTAADTQRTARMIACYGWGVWAYCALPVIVRGYYALALRATPVKVGVAMVGLNLSLNLLLVWPLAEAGLAVSTAACAGIQVIVLAAVFTRRAGPLLWRSLARTILKTILATALMAVVTIAAMVLIDAAHLGDSLTARFVAVVAPVLLGMATFFAAIRLIAIDELRLVTGRSKST
jgi:putative peptidoglycan lipid II flippase